MTKPQARKATISTTLRMVAIIWNVDECRMPVSCTSETAQTTATAIANGGASGRIARPYSPKAIAASATGAEKPTGADTQPATDPNPGSQGRQRKEDSH